MDVKMTFLNRDLKDELYMLLEGFKENSQKVYKLKKSINGLKPASC